MTTRTDEPRTTDRIEKQFEVRASRSRVWRAISDARDFGTWFGMTFDGAFAPGAIVRGRLTNPRYENVTVEFRIETMTPESYLAYHWHPGAIDPAVDYSAEPMTLVEFRLEESANGTLVFITESGFDRLPASRRVEAFRMNEGGWASQAKKLAAHVGQA